MEGIYTQNDPLDVAKKTLRDFPPSVHAISISPRGEILAYDINTYSVDDDIIDDPPRLLYIGDIGKNYIDNRQPSNLIISIGLGTALSTSVLMILVFETQKAEMLQTMITSAATPRIPATLLQYHQNAYVLTTDSIVHWTEIDDALITHVDDVEAASEIIVKSQGSHPESLSHEPIYSEKTPNGISDLTMHSKIDSVFKEVLDKIGVATESCRDFVGKYPPEDVSCLRRKAEMEIWEQLNEKIFSMQVHCLEETKKNTDIETFTQFLCDLRKNLNDIFEKISREIELSLRGADKNKIDEVKVNLEKMISCCDPGE